MKCFILFLSLILCKTMQAQQPDSVKLSLQKCVQIALANNVDINTAANNAAINSVNYQQSKAEIFPSLNGSVNHGLNVGRSINPSDNSYLSQSFTSADYGINASLSLWNGFKIRNYIRKSALDNQAGLMDVQQQKDEIIIQVIVAYLDILNQEEQLNSLLQQKQTTQVQYARLDTLNLSGAADPSDLYDLKGQLSSNEISIINQKNNVQTAKITLFQLMNMPLNMNADFEKPLSLTQPQLPENESIENIYAESLASLPLVKSAALKYQSAQKQIKVARADFYPSLQLNAGLGTAYSSAATKTIFGDYAQQETGDYIMNGAGKQPVYRDVAAMDYQKISYANQLKNNYGANINLTLNVPLFNAFRTRANVKVAKVQEKESLLQLQTVQKQLKNTIGRTYYDADAALKTWQQQQEQVVAYKEYFRISEVKFLAGTINSSEYLIAKNKLEQAETGLIAAKYNYIFKSKILSYYEGSLQF